MKISWMIIDGLLNGEHHTSQEPKRCYCSRQGLFAACLAAWASPTDTSRCASPAPFPFHNRTCVSHKYVSSSVIRPPSMLVIPQVRPRSAARPSWSCWAPRGSIETCPMSSSRTRHAEPWRLRQSVRCEASWKDTTRYTAVRGRCGASL